MTQSTPGDYCYVKWWDVGPILRAKPSRAEAKGLKWKHLSGAKRHYSRVYAFPGIFGSPNQTSSSFLRFVCLPSKENKKYRICLAEPCYGFSYIIMHFFHRTFGIICNIILWEDICQYFLVMRPIFRSKTICNFPCSPDTRGKGCAVILLRS